MPQQKQRQKQSQSQAQIRSQQFKQQFPSTISRGSFNQILSNQTVLAQQPFKSISPIPSNVAPSPYKGVVGAGSLSPQYFLNERLFEVELITLSLQTLNQMQSQYGDRKTTENELYHDIRSLVYDKALLYLLPLINNPQTSIVPKDSGKLRTAILLSIQGGGGGASGSTYTRIGNLHPFSVMVNTGKVKYASWVNAMPNNWVQHNGRPHANAWSMYTNSKGESIRTHKPKQKPHPLFDPNAQQDYFGKLVNEGHKIFEMYWDQYIRTKFADRFDNVLHNSNVTDSTLLSQMIFWRVL